VDVLKPTDDVLAQLAQQPQSSQEDREETAKQAEKSGPSVTEQVIMKNDSELELPIPTYQISKNIQEKPTTPPPVKQRRSRVLGPIPIDKKRVASPTVTPGMAVGEPPKKKNVIRWFVDSNFKQDQIRMQISENPEEWNRPHVHYWLKWAIRQFRIDCVKMQDWNMNGKELCAMTIQEFQRRVPNDPNDIFWTHLELLRKCKFVATIQKPPMVDDPVPQVLEPQPTIHKKVYRVGDNLDETVQGNLIGNRTGNNGQIQLWQFLLELLTSKEHREYIQWSGNEGEFRLLNAEVVAQLWGERKHKTTMTYEKLSRALRYYYDGDMISKVNGKR
jgi:Ets-domain/Sterile alpha motif (SAM)/Pointed domain